MNILHKIIFGIKIMFLLVLLLIYFNSHYNTKSPIYVIIHSLFVTSICIYIIYKCIPFFKTPDLDKLDYIYIIIISMLLLKNTNLDKIPYVFSLLNNNIKNETFNKIDY